MGLKRILARAVRAFAFRTGKLRWLYIRLYRPSSYDYADFLRLHGGFHAIGPETRVNYGAVVTNPAYVRIGRNCAVAACDLIGHNGAVGVLKRVYGRNFEDVGPIDIRDNSFVGHGAIVLPNVTIGPNAIVAAGSVVTRDVPPGKVVGGVPARVIGDVDDYARKLGEKTLAYPWADLIADGDTHADPALHARVEAMRIAYFFDR